MSTSQHNGPPADRGAAVPAVSHHDVATADGVTLRVSLHAPREPRAWLIVNSAMGVRRQFYRHFAAGLAERSIGVVTWDYRGVGESRLDRARLSAARLEDWGRHDLTAVIDWLRAGYAPPRLALLGHSVGGQLFGLSPAIAAVDALIGVATQSGHWRLWRGRQRLAVVVLWYAAIPLLTPLAGRFPASWLGLGQDLPPGVAQQWARWGRDRDYLRSARVGPQPQYFESIRVPLRTYLVPDDHLAAEDAVRTWHDWFENADRELVTLPARSVGGERLGHFGFFDPELGATEWQSVAEFVLGSA